MCNCPNGASGRFALVAVLVIAAEITTLFSFIWVLLFGLVTMITCLLPLCKEVEKTSLICGGIMTLLVAVGQIVTAAIINEDTLQFCNEDSGYDMEETAMCNLTLYRGMNAAGAVLWILAGVISMTISDPRTEVIRARPTSAVAPHASNVVTPQASRSTTASPDGKMTTPKIEV